LSQPGNSADIPYLGTTAGLGAPDEQYTNWRCTEIPDLSISDDRKKDEMQNIEGKMKLK